MTIKQLNPETTFGDELLYCSISQKYFAEKYFNIPLDDKLSVVHSLNAKATIAFITWLSIFQSDKTIVYKARNRVRAKELLDHYIEQYNLLKLPNSELTHTHALNQVRMKNGTQLVTGEGTNLLRGRTIDTLIIDDGDNAGEYIHMVSPIGNIVRIVR